jgi:hypothetical protein
MCPTCAERNGQSQGSSWFVKTEQRRIDKYVVLGLIT